MWRNLSSIRCAAFCAAGPAIFPSAEKIGTEIQNCRYDLFFIPRSSSRFLPHAPCMSYQTYITEALIVGSFDSNTADKSYLLFTKTAGMLYASAKSVREERSRQRFALQDFSLITVSLIKGKTGWRIGSVQSEGNLFSQAVDREVRGSVVRICKLLRRFVAGEEPHPELYEEVMLGLASASTAASENRLMIEEIIRARLLYSLGYIASTKDIQIVLETDLEMLLTRTLPTELFLTLKAVTDKATAASHL